MKKLILLICATLLGGYALVHYEDIINIPDKITDIIEEYTTEQMTNLMK